MIGPSFKLEDSNTSDVRGGSKLSRNWRNTVFAHTAEAHTHTHKTFPFTAKTTRPFPPRGLPNPASIKIEQSTKTKVAHSQTLSNHRGWGSIEIFSPSLQLLN